MNAHGTTGIIYGGNLRKRLSEEKDKKSEQAKIDEQKEEIVQTNETEIKAEKENEIETVVTEEAESLAVATISSALKEASL